MLKLIVTYDTKTWTLIKEKNTKLYMRNICLIKNTFGSVWRIRINNELQEMYKEPNIVVSTAEVPGKGWMIPARVGENCWRVWRINRESWK